MADPGPVPSVIDTYIVIFTLLIDGQSYFNYSGAYLLYFVFCTQGFTLNLGKVCLFVFKKKREKSNPLEDLMVFAYDMGDLQTNYILVHSH